MIWRIFSQQGTSTFSCFFRMPLNNCVYPKFLTLHRHNTNTVKIIIHTQHMHAKTIIPRFFINIDKIICYVYYLDANVFMFAYARLRNLFKIQWLTTFKKTRKERLSILREDSPNHNFPCLFGGQEPP